MRKILLLGASGYVGGRLRVELERKGERIRCLSRRPEFLRCERCEVMQGDVQDLESLRLAFRDIDTAYYLVRSLGSPLQSRFDRLLRAGRLERTALLGCALSGARTPLSRDAEKHGEAGEADVVQICFRRIVDVTQRHPPAQEILRGLTQAPGCSCLTPYRLDEWSPGLGSVYC